MNMELQFFGGRGSGGGKGGAGGGAPAGTEISPRRLLLQEPGAVVAIEHFSAITGKPDGKYIEYTLDDNYVFHSQGYGSFDRNQSGLASLTSKNGVTPKIVRVKAGKSWGQDQLDRQNRAKAKKERRRLGME